MSWDFDNGIPIYLQIMDKIKMKIISGELSASERLDSVRDLAQQSGVNPNTMQRAMAELEREGLIYSERTAGRFVSSDSDMINSLRQSMAESKIRLLLSALCDLGYDKACIADMVNENIKAMKGEEYE